MRADGTPRRRAGLMWRLTDGFTARSRRRRFEAFMELMRPAPADTILDMGVTDKSDRSSNFFEALYPWPASITAVAPQPSPSFQAAFPDVRLVVANGNELPFDDQSFDIGFSNAVVEHVGTRDDQRAFVAEMVRTCRRVFVCTPNAGFPIDPHTLWPFVHWFPRPIRNPLLRLTGNHRWASESALNPLRAHDFLELFPQDANVRLVRQRVMGWTTVLIAVGGRG
ncbi:MAG TPA: methyltransferase domain-containing protein [Gammaproteobacteria bacterium]|nr:methyltransferase domain-containing protein [Gammaproteobacteria bacterium]